MMNIIEWLEKFNSKERFFLIGQALGNAKFSLSPEFRQELQTTFEISLPSDVFAAMDYHLDWIYASLYLAVHGESRQPFFNEPKVIEATQEDTDLLIAYDAPDGCHLIFLEAKGVTGWTNEQMGSKARRLRAIFGDDGNFWPGVIPHFAMISPRQSKGIVVDGLPKWMAPNSKISWIKLVGAEERWRVHRCDEQGKETREGKHWTIARR